MKYSCKITFRKKKNGRKPISFETDDLRSIETIIHIFNMSYDVNRIDVKIENDPFDVDKLVLKNTRDVLDFQNRKYGGLY